MRQKIKTIFHQIPEQFRNQDYRANYDVIGKYVVEGWIFYLLSYLQTGISTKVRSYADT